MNVRSKRVALILLVSVALAGLLEGGSSYVLYRYYSQQHKSFSPSGSASYLLLHHLALRLRGDHMRVNVSSDHFPLFRPDDELGFVMNPGEYQIIEQYGPQKHMFHIRVDENGNRATSNFPVQATHRLFITGDSYIFGLGVNDEQTVPWLLQASMPNVQVINFSLSSYSTLHALMQLRAVRPELGSEDTVVLLYHPLTNDLNVVVPGILDMLQNGYEVQLGDAKQMAALRLPYAEMNSDGSLMVRYVPLACGVRNSDAQCKRRAITPQESVRVTENLFDAIAKLHPGNLIVAVVSGGDDDPVVAHMRQQGIVIADLRVADDEPDANDVLPNDNHVGPFRQYAVFTRLLTALRRRNLVH